MASLVLVLTLPFLTPVFYYTPNVYNSHHLNRGDRKKEVEEYIFSGNSLPLQCSLTNI